MSQSSLDRHLMRGVDMVRRERDRFRNGVDKQDLSYYLSLSLFFALAHNAMSG